jgi:hypothetical protein
MFQWYRDADVCYAYLQDVRDDSDPQAKVKAAPSEFNRSEWWQRGWTLQELIAPRILYFYDTKWRCIGSRNMLAAAVSEITSIDIEYFNSGDLSRYSIAQKMSWASERKTTRVEDAAYCMLGIFGINMPLLYGEGEGAFQRLQEEILRRSADSSIFAWEKTRYVPQLLAPAPLYFRRYGSLSRVNERQFYGLYSTATIIDRGASVTSKGVEITLPFIRRDAISSKQGLAKLKLLDKVAI